MKLMDHIPALIIAVPLLAAFLSTSGRENK